MAGLRLSLVGPLRVAFVTLFVAACGAAPASPAAQSPAPSAQAVSAAPLILEGKFALSPDRGPWGTAVVARASGMRPGVRYDVMWTSVEGSWKLSPDGSEYKGREYKPTQSKLATVTADAQGAFAVEFQIPEDFGFQHDVTVMQDGAIRNKSAFEVEMQVRISPTSGPVGTPITVEARGIGWRQLQNSWLVSYDNAFTGWLSSVTTRGLARALIPATGAPGVHMVTILHGEFTFPYLNMQQNPDPNRPQIHIPFTVTPGPPVLPAAAATQGLPVRSATLPAGSGIWTDPPEGVVGSETFVRGRGLAPNTDLELTWTTMVGNRVSGSGFEQQVKKLGAVRTDANGDFAYRLAVPDDLGGAHKISATSADRALAETEFTTQPHLLPLSVDRGPSGTKLSIHLKGVGWTETANIYHLVYDNAYAGYACGFNSRGDVEMLFYVSGVPGWHFIDLYPGIYKGAETRPLNFRIPQLTYADDHPGEKLPAFRLAFLITDP